MEKKNKILKLWIIIMSVVCFICIALLFLINVGIKNDLQDTNQIKENSISSEQENQYEQGDEFEAIKKDTSRNLSYVKDRTTYFTVKSIVTTYIDSAAYHNSNIVLKQLSNDVIEKYKLNEENVIQKTNIKQIQNSKIYLQHIIEEIIESEQENYIMAYLVKSKYRMNNAIEYINTQTLVIMDKSRKVYEIYPYQYIVDNKWANLHTGDKLDLKTINISEDAQEFSYVERTDRELANELFNDWNEKMFYDKSNAYNKLNSEFKNKKYNSLKFFQTYLNNLGYIPRINEYRTYSTKDYTDYICTDQYNNYYIFRQQGGIMRYTVFLDNYTVELDTFKQNYEKADESTKVAIQIGKFKQMLNTKDYNAIYNKLNETFKKNNYPTIAKLENTLKQNAYGINTIELKDYNKNEDYYVCECSLINQKNTNEQKDMTLIIKLIDSNNFEMSFSIG